ncbi:MAG: hypothetical protein KDA69_05245 [Planctomycetaceae bacterium]|nr:hypothetical protein [Planctomycetaceae bacterium]
MRLVDKLTTPLPPKKSRPYGLFSLLAQWCQSPFERASTKKKRLNQERLEQLASIETISARRQNGRVLTLVAGLSETPLELASYLRPWLRSVQQVGLRGTVLYAGKCDLALLQEQYPGIETIEVTVGSRHLFLERHFAIREYLQSIDDERVFITDGVDVAFRRDPFEMISQDATLLYLGREEDSIGESRHTLKKMHAAYGELFHHDWPVLNPGIIGGHRTRVIELLDILTAEIDGLECSGVDCDMGIYNKVVHDHIPETQIVSGAPLHSRFSHWEFNTPAAIIHK